MRASDDNTRTARAELQYWYLHRLLPKLARAATTGAVDRAAAAALDADVRALLDLAREHERAA